MNKFETIVLMVLWIIIVLLVTGCSINSTYIDPSKDVLWHPDNPTVTFWNPDERVRSKPKLDMRYIDPQKRQEFMERFSILKWLYHEKQQQLIDKRDKIK